ncbi:YhjD/YihY/BrkB family envelope integrity protein [Streptomyces sp. NPDC048603]|uniref:YhjD/YihY/BrkB family envelope integrity protein n=1 Tax=Streptomyces sp. NPDC048603 TaxID=3365577 RepID=UPI00371113D4
MAERLTAPLEHLTARLLEVNLVESAIRLAAQTFLAALPLLIVVAAFAPPDLQDLMADSLSAVLGIRGETLQEVRTAYQAEGSVRDASGAVGILVALLSATALSRALQRVCERIWRLPKASLRNAAWRWLAWLVVWLVVLFCQAPIRDGFGTGSALGVVLALIVSVLLWWWTPHLMLCGRIGWAPLLPGALLTGLAMVLVGYASELLMPGAMQRGYQEFGPLGPVFTLLTWLITVFVVAVVGLTLGQWAGTSAWYGRFTRRG